MAEESVGIEVVNGIPKGEFADSQESYARKVLGDDSEYQELLEIERKAAEGGKKGEPADSGDGDVDGSADGSADGSGADDDSGEADGSDDDESADDKNAEAQDVGSSEFEDDIIPGLKGDQFGSLDESMQELIANAGVALKTAKEEQEKNKGLVEKLLQDPIVRHRKELLDAGKASDEYDIPPVSDADIDKIQSLADVGTPEAREEIRKIVKATVDRVAEYASNNAMLREKNRVSWEQTKQSAAEKLLAIGKLTKSIKGDFDVNKILNTPVSQLPDGIKSVVTELQNRQNKGTIGNFMKYLAETDAEEVYAQMAVKFKWPVVKNADKEIREMIKKSNREVINRFRKDKDAAGGLPRGTEVDAKGASKGVVRDGINIVKLATDEEYHERMLYSKRDKDWPDKIGRLAEEGERMIENNPRLARSKTKP